jgi:transcriptional regulator with XRE-family HTH domain
MGTISDRIRYLRKKVGLSQDEVAAKIGLNFGTYQKWEYGQRPSYKNLQKIIGFYNCNESWLLTGEGYPFGKVLKKIPPNELHIGTMHPEKPEFIPKAPPDTSVNDLDVSDLLSKTEKILKSKTTYAKALAQNIDAFYQAICDSKSIEVRLKRLEETIEKLTEQPEPPKKGNAI